MSLAEKQIMISCEPCGEGFNMVGGNMGIQTGSMNDPFARGAGLNVQVVTLKGEEESGLSSFDSPLNK